MLVRGRSLSLGAPFPIYQVPVEILGEIDKVIVQSSPTLITRFLLAENLLLDFLEHIVRRV